MGYQVPFPAELEQVEYVKLFFHLEICDYFDLPALGLLQLRRELLQVLRVLQDQKKKDIVSQLRQLLQPTLSENSVLLRKTQKLSPAVVFSPDISQRGLIEPKQRIILPALFIGSGINAIDAFVRLLQQLGKQGLYHGTGQFILEGVETEDASGLRSMLWWHEEQAKVLLPPVNDLLWWLERQKPLTDSLLIEIISPLRLIHQGKPLFQAGFVNIFPFVLRRVTALLAGHAGVDLITDPARLISLARSVKSVENRLRWQDWRKLKKEQGNQNLGGLMGHLTVTGDELAELIWILQLGSLLNLGKGAAYGAGQYRLKSC